MIAVQNCTPGGRYEARKATNRFESSGNVLTFNAVEIVDLGSLTTQVGSPGLAVSRFFGRPEQRFGTTQGHDSLPKGMPEEACFKITGKGHNYFLAGASSRCQGDCRRNRADDDP